MSDINDWSAEIQDKFVDCKVCDKHNKCKSLCEKMLKRFEFSENCERSFERLGITIRPHLILYLDKKERMDIINGLQKWKK